MIFNKEDYDTKILKNDTFKLLLGNDIISEKDLLKLFSTERIDIIFCFAKFSTNNIALLDKLEFNLISTRVTYRLLNLDNYKKKSENIHKGYSIVRNSERKFDLKPENTEEIAQVIGSTSRYFKDKLIKPKKSLEIYTRWIENSLYNHYANESFLVTAKNNELIGLVTLKVKGKNGFIDLIGIREEFQKFGLGKVLLYEGVRYFMKNNIEDIFVITEGENVVANAFYQKNGFVVCDFDLVYHKHFNL